LDPTSDSETRSTIARLRQSTWVGIAAWRADGIAGLAIALAIALGWLYWLLPLGFLSGASPYWQTDVDDITEYLSGFNAFFSEPWGWPLLRINGINTPEGTLATFVDIVPLYAALLKLVVPSDRFPFNPFGYWVGLCYLLQAVGAWWLVREARLPRYSALIALAGLLLVMPALIARVAFGHVSLASQWLILFALALYLRGGRSRRPVLAGWTVLLFAAFYINLYLFVMIGLIFIGDVTRFRAHLSWWQMLGRALLPPALILGSLPLTILPIPHAAAAEGFGFYSMNLLAPVLGGGRVTGWMTGHREWTFADGQYEGYNYLGAGLLSLLVVGIVVRLRHDPRFFRRHGILFAMLTFASLYALSNRVYLDHRHVLAWPVPRFLEWPFGMFRVSGRFFWPMGYALVVFAVLTCTRWLPLRVAGCTLVLALALQWVDLQPVFGLARHALERPARRLIDSALWDEALGRGVHTIYIHPKLGCGRTPSAHRGILTVQRYAVERRLRLNTGHLPRYRPRCDAGPREIAASDPTTSAYVFLRGEASAHELVDRFPPGARLRCRELDIAVMCRWLGDGARP
jgi:hypothetical protein